eukprot:CFRG6857T1
MRTSAGQLQKQTLKGLRNVFQRPPLVSTSANKIGSTNAQAHAQGLCIATTPLPASAHTVAATTASGRNFSSAALSSSAQTSATHTYISWVLDSIKALWPVSTTLFTRNTRNATLTSNESSRTPLERRSSFSALVSTSTAPNWEYLTAQQLSVAAQQGNGMPLIFSPVNVNAYYRERAGEAFSLANNRERNNMLKSQHSTGYTITRDVFNTVCTYLFLPVKRMSISAVETTHGTLSYALMANYSTPYTHEERSESEKTNWIINGVSIAGMICIVDIVLLGVGYAMF